VANEERWRHFISHIEPGRLYNRVLDVGCATGGFLVAAQGRGWEVYGVEPSPGGAQEAARRTGAQIHVGTLDTAPFEDGWFDAITLWDVIEHVQSPRAYLAHAARLVRPGGFISMLTPNVHGLAFRLLGRGWSAIGPNDHIYYFAPLTMSRLLKSSGFRIHSMATGAVKADVWRRWLRYRALGRLAEWLSRLSLARPVAGRLLLGDDLYVVGRREKGIMK
jgi:SAM-dependent methyltransferase